MELERGLVSEYILRTRNFEAGSLLGLQKKSKVTPFVALEFKGVSSSFQ